MLKYNRHCLEPPITIKSVFWIQFLKNNLRCELKIYAAPSSSSKIQLSYTMLRPLLLFTSIIWTRPPFLIGLSNHFLSPPTFSRASYLTLGKVSGGAPTILWNFPNGTMWQYCPVDEAVWVRSDPVENSVVAALGNTHVQESDTRRIKFKYYPF